MGAISRRIAAERQTKFKRAVSLLAVAFAIVSLLYPSLPVEAQQYHCDGRIQHRPCGQKLHSYKRNVTAGTKSSKSGYAKKKKDPDAYARVLEHRFKTVSKSEGLWKGVIEGNGMVHLRLNIIKSGQVTDSRYMGRVYLDNKSTWFAFKSPIPKDQDWSWNIQAFNG